MVEEALERWAGAPNVCSHHERTAQADPVALWEAAQSVKLSDTRTLGRLVRWRIPGTPAEMTYGELFRRYPFTELETGDTWSLSGLCGKIWTLQRDYPRLDGPEAFAEWDESGTVKVLFAHWTRPVDGGAEIVSEARVTAVDKRAELRLRGLWAVVGRFERLIGAEPLVLATKRAQPGSADHRG